MSGRRARLFFIITMLLFCFDAFVESQRIGAANRFAAAREMREPVQACNKRRRRLHKRRPSQRSAQSPQSNPIPATKATKPDNMSQPVLRVYNPAEDGQPPVRPTPTPGMKDP
jgi:hypothetical protein